MLFISHSSRDHAVAAQVRAGLAHEGFTAAFLDFEPEHGIPPGRRWEDELYVQLRKADIVVFLATHAAAESPWCHAELAMARSIGRTIVPVLLEPGAEHPLLRDTQWIRVDPDDAPPAIAAALRRLTGEERAPTWDQDLAPSPYPGLLSFDERRAGVFFGRREEISAVIDRLTWRHAEGTERLVFVAGSSGSGKSSLIRAGVLPRLALSDAEWVMVPTFIPGRAPLEQLARALHSAMREHGREMSWQDIAKCLEQGDDGLEELARDLLDAAGAAGDDRGVLLSIDQGEQLVTQSARADRIRLIDLLVRALEASTPLRCVVTIRSEYLGELVESTALEGRAATTLTLGRLSPGRLAEVIEQPAQRAGIEFEPGLVQGMVEETTAGAISGGDPLPLLAFTLRRLDDRREDQRRITRADYDAIGGVVGSLRTEADRIHERLEAAGKEAHVIPALLELVGVEQGRDPAGRSAPRSRFDADGWAVIEAFRNARLLTTDGEGPTVSLAHEALLREWPVLNRAIERSRDDLIARARLERDAHEWEGSGRDPSYLISGQRLEAARSALAGRRPADPGLAQFVGASRKRSRRQVRRSRLLLATVVIAVGAGIAVAASYVADDLRERNRIEAARADTVYLPTADVTLDQHEVTVEQYRLCVDERRCTRPAQTGADPVLEVAPDELPVVLADLRQASAFCAWIGRDLPTLPQLKGAGPRLTHLLDLLEGGGREWTSTKTGIAYQTLYRDPRSQDTETIDANPSFQSSDLGFRCAGP